MSYDPGIQAGRCDRRGTAQGNHLGIHADHTLVTEAKLPFDFVINDRGCTSLVRVRRLKYAQYSVPEIVRLCAQEIKELREPKLPDGIFRELWVRGPDRTWHRYLVLEDGIEPLENEDSRQDENNFARSPSANP